MAKLWITLSTRWKLEDVQAVLNVIISLTSAIGIFTFARWSWQRSTLAVAHNRHVPLSRLLSLSSPGEVFDVISMMRLGLFAEGHLRIVAQCTIVLLLSVATILSGPVSRFSTRRGTTTERVKIPGYLASDDMNSIGLANVQWNQTMFQLDQAGFPYNQLLDYLPDSSIHWLYVKKEWNSSWSAECDTLPLTHIDLGQANSNVPKNDSVWEEIPAVTNLFPPAFRNSSTHDMWESGNGYYIHGDLFKDNLIFFMSSRYTNSSVNMSIAALHLKDVPRATDGVAYFASGPIPYSSYTRVTCSLTRSAASLHNHNVAFPWTWDTQAIVQAYNDNYQARFMLQSTSNSHVSVPSGEEMFRFYQVYMITKDTMLQEPVAREITVVLANVEMSTFFLIAMVALVLFIIIGNVNYLYFYSRYYHVVQSTPQTKLDWMLHSIKEADHEPPPGPRDSFRGTSPADVYEMPLGTRRSEFASAMYGPSPDADGRGRVRRSSSKGFFELFSSPTLQQTPTMYMGLDPSSSSGSRFESGAGLGFLDNNGRPIRVTQGYLRMPDSDT